MPSRRANPFDQAEQALREYALSFPGTDSGKQGAHGVVRAGRRPFLYLSRQDGAFGVSALLAESGPIMLALGFTIPTPYGLAARGWVTGMFNEGDEVPVDMLELWIEESYRAVASKKLLAQLDAGVSGR